MRTGKSPRSSGWCLVLAGLGVLLAMTAPALVSAQGAGGPAGVTIKIRARNLSAADTPFCGIGGGMVGDRFELDAFMDMDGVVTGTARFEDALHQVTLFEVDRLFEFNGGVALRNEASGHAVAIWMADFLVPFGAPALVNVQLAFNCE